MSVWRSLADVTQPLCKAELAVAYHSKERFRVPVSVKNTPEHPVARRGTVVCSRQIRWHFDNLLGMVVFNWRIGGA